MLCLLVRYGIAFLIHLLRSIARTLGIEGLPLKGCYAAHYLWGHCRNDDCHSRKSQESTAHQKFARSMIKSYLVH